VKKLEREGKGVDKEVIRKSNREKVTTIEKW